MKIGFTGIDLPEGKIKYKDKVLEALAAKDKPKKISPFFAEFIKDEFVQADAIVVPPDKLLDVLILDMEKLETRLNRAPEEAEKQLLQKCLDLLENETPLCDAEFTETEEEILKGIAPHSKKPVIRVEEGTPVNDIIEKALDQAGYMFFYTSGPTESHAWLVKKGSDIVTCAGTIHTDLARGFIKGDVVSVEDYLNCHNFKECISKGIAKLVDRDYIVQPNEVIEIRFSV